jgi:hypothetical protein
MNAPAPARQDMVTASDLVRQFSTWRERAARNPVYVLHRGRPRLVLTSMAVMDALCAPHDDAMKRLTALLDASPELIVLIDRSLCVIAASRSARARFGDAVATGAPIDGLAPAPLGAALTAAALRVAQSSQAETLDLPLSFDPSRSMSLALEPYPDGLALFGRLPGDSDTLADVRMEHDALEEAVAIAQDVASVQVNLGGYIDGSTAGLSALTGFSEQVLDATRFATMFAPPTGDAIGAGVTTVLTDGRPRLVTADLLIKEGDTRPATVALAPLIRAAAIKGVLALVIAASRPFPHT